MRSQKILPRHLDRAAVVYVRQSTVRQVLENQESTRLQYALVERAVQLGWPRDRVTVIDEDQGKSGASAEGRAGFQRLVFEVTLGHVGLILGIEMSRLARSCKDWHQLLEACGLFGSLIADLDGVYDPADYNDRLLLGLKGTMSEAELHVLKQRMFQGKIAKARRGELAFRLPIGYVRPAGGGIALDPDAEVQGAVRAVFRTFAEHGSLQATLYRLASSGVRLGVRVGDQLEWRLPNRATLQNLLHNPTYAGAYAYGRRQVDARRKQPGRPDTGRVVQDPEQWHVLLKDHHPAYITWEQYESNVARLEANRIASARPGPVRKGDALLTGILLCARCGWRMGTHYSASGGHTYVCHNQVSDRGGVETRCSPIVGARLDRHVSECLLDALAPASLEVSLQATKDIERERAEQRRLKKQRILRARYEADRARRQYDLVDPENRLVVDNLESTWEKALRELRRLEEDLERFEAAHAPGLTELEREAIARLSQDLPALWNGPQTTVSERKEILREAIDQVAVSVRDRSEVVDVTIRWKGGTETRSQCTRPVSDYARLSYLDAMLKRIDALVAAGCCLHDVVTILNREGYRPPKRTGQFTSGMVRHLLHQTRKSLPKGRRTATLPDLRQDEWTLPALARELRISVARVFGWLQRGLIQARETRDDGGRMRWLVVADPAEIRRLRRFIERTPIPSRTAHADGRARSETTRATP